MIFSLPWSPVPQPNSICRSACQSCLKPLLKQGAQEVHSISGIFNTERATILEESSIGIQEGPQLLVPGMAVTEWRRKRGQTETELNPGSKPLASRGGVRCPGDTQKGAPSPPPRGLPRHSTCPPLHSNPLQPQGETTELEAALPSCSGPLGQMGWEGREPLESPQVRRQSALQTNLGLYTEPVLDPGPWVADGSNYQKASVPPTRVKANP